jgi:hypothetical protein
MGERNAPYSAFRLNLEQQQKRAKELLRAAKSTEPDALRRMAAAGLSRAAEWKLAHAQHCIARELRFPSWAELKRHIGAMAEARAALGASAPDGDCRTMHIRCGNDIEQTLASAGFRGDFNVHANPYLQGPVTDAPDWLAQRVRYIADASGPYLDLDYAAVLERCTDEEHRLSAASRGYERVALWLEHDCYDQFVLLRCLTAFAEHGVPPRLELIGPNDFPGAARFVGLGQLPPEALQLLWERRTPVRSEQIALGVTAWNAFRAPDPSALADLARRGTAELPNLAAALRRHLEELPWLRDGLGLTQRLLLRALAEHGAQPAGRLVGLVMHHYDPLPGLGDIGYDLTLREMEAGARPLVRRDRELTRGEWHLAEISITDFGHEVLAGRQDHLAFAPAERWIGGVRIANGQRNWRWDADAGRVLLR